MRAAYLAPIVLLCTTVGASPARAQRVSADILVHDGAIAGRVVLGQPREYPRPVIIYRQPVRRVVVLQRRQPRLIVVERFHRARGHEYRQGHHHRLTRVVVFYDPRSGRYYDCCGDRRLGLREVAVYQENGRYYQDHDDEDFWDDR